MTQRERAITSTAAAAEATIRREAEANNEQPWDATAENVRIAVEGAAQSRFDESWSWKQFATAVTRRVEEGCEVRRGAWS